MIDPKEKAVEIISKYCDVIAKATVYKGITYKGEEKFYSIENTAKECAKIDVQNTIDASPSLPILGDSGTFGEDIELSKKLLARSPKRTKQNVMIDVKSLRLGNILKDHKGRLREVAYITECVGLKNDIGGVDKYQKDPITSYDIATLSYVDLSEDILLKCEGIENEFDMCLNINDRAALAIDIKPNGVIATIFTEYDEFEVKCDYLHELQNLIKYLTNKDLIINF